MFNNNTFIAPPTTEKYNIRYNPYCLAPEGLRDLGITFSVCVCVCVCVCVMSGKNVKVFELTIFLSSTMNMVTQIIYLGRMEVGDWYYAVCFLKIFS